MSKGSKKETTSSATATPIVDPRWKTAYDQFLTGAEGMIGQPSLNPSQTQARDYFSANMNPTQYTLKPAERVTAGNVTPYLWNAQRTESMPAYNTTDAAYDPATASRGSEFINDYKNPYLKDVLDTTFADYDTQAARDLASRQAARGAGAAFGTGADVSDALYSADSARGRASLGAGIRSNAFNTAAGFGMQDADRLTNTALANAAAKAGISTFNAGARNTAASQAFGTEAARRTNEAGRIDAASQNNVANYLNADTGNAERAFAANTGNANRALTVDQGNADLFNSNRAFGLNNAGALAAMGQTEFGQGQTGWERLLRALQLGTAQFGQQSNGTNTETKTPGLFDWLTLGANAFAGGKK